MSTASDAPYEVNFVFPWRDLENDRVKLVLFDVSPHPRPVPAYLLHSPQPAIHGPAYWEGTQDHPSLYDYLPWGPFPSLPSFTHYLTPRLASPSSLVLAVLDKSSPSSPGTPLAGIVGFLNADAANLSVEVGLLVCLPAFQRRRVTYAAVALLLQYCLNVPAEGGLGGLGLRRVQYQANSRNEKSVGFARRMGFRLEGIVRWQRVLDGSKPGNGGKLREGDPRPGRGGRDTALLSMCWDDWEEGRRDAVCRPEYVMYAS